MKGLAFAHAFTTQTPSLRQVLRQQELIATTIRVRDLTDRVNQPSKSTADTKLSRAKVLYKANSTLSRNEMIGLFVKELGLTDAGATTYYSRIKSNT